MGIIELKNINKHYGEHKILNNFSLDINKGEMVAITGASGRGKSTILNIMGLLEGFDSGDYLIDGEKNVKVNSRRSVKILRETINYLFQNFALIDEESVGYNLELALKYVRANKTEKKNMIKNALNQVGLDGYEKKKIYELSGGEQQRVSISRCMLKPSKIILADEPTGSLDESNVKLVLNLLKVLNEKGKTVIIVTHDKFVASNCTREISL
ncbi:putative ABC transport system ATP-binding protein [Clostridium acidisoli DSM 12555]|uniref:Putative ABC transport system ATP-binding protein n=1 Tax=Clostridium acidisoli DSM 12555 TaxID=1121291 RepID=A0A1W1XMA4_9CLOT|nr:putative bacteriocin export ABC transporter [Clostridium acidisoli]SMC24984.1 putative ABC transport system ATP-binding protein [Clostridium acidisoli DSM 12555]